MKIHWILLFWTVHIQNENIVLANSNPTCKMARTSFFDELVHESSSSIFIDKTLLIKEFLETKAKLILATYPRRWAKTVNLHMIRNFLQIHQDDAENAKMKNLFFGHNLEIAKTRVEVTGQGFVESHTLQGIFPVIWFSFENMYAHDFMETFEYIKTDVIGKAFQDHSYLKHSLNDITLNRSSSSSENLRIFELWLNGGKRATEAEVVKSLRLLTELLHAHYNKKVYVFVDEYDKSIAYGYSNFGGHEKEFENVMHLLTKIYNSTFNDNSCIAKGFLTGAVRTAKNYMFPEIKEFAEYNLLDSHISEYYSFRRQDINRICEKCSLSADCRKEIDYWYKGYGNLYSGWSILNYVSERPSAPVHPIYWVDTGPTLLFEEFCKHQLIANRFKSLLVGAIPMTLKKGIDSSDYRVLFPVLNAKPKYKFPSDGECSFFSFLVIAGYLVALEPKNLDPLFFTANVTIPNREIRWLFKESLNSRYKNKYNFSSEEVNGTAVEFEGMVNNLLLEKEDGNNFAIKLQRMLSAVGSLGLCAQQAVHDIFFLICITIEEKMGLQFVRVNESHVLMIHKDNGIDVQLKVNGYPLNGSINYVNVTKKEDTNRIIKVLWVRIDVLVEHNVTVVGIKHKIEMKNTFA